MPALIQYDSPPSLPIPLLPFSFYSFLTVGLAHLANSALGAGREMDPPPRGGDPSPFLVRWIAGPAGPTGRSQLASCGRAGLAKRGGANWPILVGPGGPKGKGRTG